MSRLLRAVSIAALVLVLLPLSAAAQVEHFDKRVPFAFDQLRAIDATVGPVHVTNLKITDLGRGYGRGSFLKLPPPSELSTTLRLAFDIDNPKSTDWSISVTVEFLDRTGTVIDRVTKKKNYESETAVLTIEHPLLEYVVPMITDVRVILGGRPD